MSSFGDWFDKELCWISGHSYQIIESSFSQKFYYAGLRDGRKEGPQLVNYVVLITTLLQHCTFQEYVLNCQSPATILASSWWSSGQDIGFCGLGMANSYSGYHNLLVFCMVVLCWKYQLSFHCILRSPFYFHFISILQPFEWITAQSWWQHKQLLPLYSTASLMANIKNYCCVTCACVGTSKNK